MIIKVGLVLCLSQMTICPSNLPLPVEESEMEIGPPTKVIFSDTEWKKKACLSDIFMRF